MAILVTGGTGFVGLNLVEALLARGDSVVILSNGPLPELAGYRTPVRGLFLTGASTHPGGGVFGASGRTAARVVLAARAAAGLA